jgi:hypothetical protein
LRSIHAVRAPDPHEGHTEFGSERNETPRCATFVWLRTALRR